MLAGYLVVAALEKVRLFLPLAGAGDMREMKLEAARGKPGEGKWPKS